MAEQFPVPDSVRDDPEMEGVFAKLAQIGEMTPSTVADAPVAYDQTQIQGLVDRIAELEAQLKTANVVRDI